MTNKGKPGRKSKAERVFRELYGTTIEEKMPELIENLGTARAVANETNLPTYSIIYWLKKLGYQSELANGWTWTRQQPNGAVEAFQ
jgi:hypothetical protein